MNNIRTMGQMWPVEVLKFARKAKRFMHLVCSFNTQSSFEWTKNTSNVALGCFKKNFGARHEILVEHHWFRATFIQIGNMSCVPN